MANYTSKLNLEKPLTSEKYDVVKVNANSEKIDAFATDIAAQLAEKVRKENELKTDFISKSLPNGIRSKLILTQDKIVINTAEYIIQASDLVELRTTYTGVDYIFLKKPIDSSAYNKTFTTHLNLLYNTIYYAGFGNKAGAMQLNANDVNKVMAEATGDRIVIGIVKGTYSSLAHAQSIISNTKMLYQLNTPLEIALSNDKSPNTKEIARVSEQVDKLTNAIIALGGTII